MSTSHPLPQNTAEPVETKVKAATIGAGAGAIVSTFCLWGLDELFWEGPATVPEPVQGMVYLIITSAFAFASGYRAKHTPR